MKSVFYWSFAFIIFFLLSACSTTLYKIGIDVERWRAGMKEKSLDINDLHLSYSVVLEDTGHAPMMEEPEASAGHYLHFLAAPNITLIEARGF